MPNYTYDLLEQYDGWTVRRSAPGQRPMYLYAFRNYRYSWCYDYLYARKTSKKTAQKHANTLTAHDEAIREAVKLLLTAAKKLS